MIGGNGFDIPQDVLDFNAAQRNDGPVNAIDPNFEIPSQYRWNLGVKHTLPWDIEMTADFIYSRVKEEVLWQDIRLQQIGTAPDGRPIYGPRPDGRTSSSIQDFLLTNTSEGESTVFSIDASKTWRTGAGRFDAYLGYGYQDVKDVNPGHEFDGVLELGQRRRLRPERPAGSRPRTTRSSTCSRGTFAWRKAFFGDYETSVALFGERRSGRPYSYTFGGGTPQAVWGDPRQASRQRQLFYVPDGDVIFEAPVHGGRRRERGGRLRVEHGIVERRALGAVRRRTWRPTSSSKASSTTAAASCRAIRTAAPGCPCSTCACAGTADLPQDARRPDVRHRELRQHAEQRLGPAAPGQLSVLSRRSST